MIDLFMAILDQLKVGFTDREVLLKAPLDDSKRVKLVRAFVGDVLDYVRRGLDDVYRQMKGRPVVVMNPTNGALRAMFEESADRAESLGVDLAGLFGGNDLDNMMKVNFGEADFSFVTPRDVGVVVNGRGAISLGSMESVLGPANEPTLKGTSLFVQTMIERRAALLAVCFSSQVLAREVGGIVERMEEGLRLGLVDVVRANGAESILKVLGGDNVGGGRVFAANEDHVVSMPKTHARLLLGDENRKDGMIVVAGDGPLFEEGDEAGVVEERLKRGDFVSLATQVHWDTFLRRLLECVVENKEEWWESDLDYLVAKLKLMANLVVGHDKGVAWS